ncbi:MAG: hypothetical protein NC818_02725 [Candidatus Omnitrophica bacterium]|nr:hypothetical protein [Candidatus Omnitrophota bacterium]
MKKTDLVRMVFRFKPLYILGLLSLQTLLLTPQRVGLSQITLLIRRVKFSEEIREGLYPFPLSAEELQEAIENLSPARWYSRTAVIPLGNGFVQAVKFLKKGESITELTQEASMIQELRDKGIEISPLLVKGEDGEYIFEYRGKFLYVPEEVDASGKYISYIVPQEYFIYPENINDPEKMMECALLSLSQFARLLKAGYLHRSLSPLTHEQNSGREWLWNYVPIGGIENLQDSLKYANMGLAGLRDFAHVSEIIPDDYLYFSVGQALCEWAITITYHSLKNGFSQSQTFNILAAGFERFLSEWELDIKIVEENIDKLESFVSLVRQEIKNNALSSQNDGGKPTINNLVGFVKKIMEKMKESSLYSQWETATVRVEYVSFEELDRNFAIELRGRMVVQEGELRYVTNWHKRCLEIFHIRDGSYHRYIAPGSIIMPKEIFKEGNIIYVVDTERKCMVKITLP